MREFLVSGSLSGDQEFPNLRAEIWSQTDPRYFCGGSADIGDGRFRIECRLREPEDAELGLLLRVYSGDTLVWSSRNGPPIRLPAERDEVEVEVEIPSLGAEPESALSVESLHQPIRALLREEVAGSSFIRERLQRSLGRLVLGHLSAAAVELADTVGDEVLVIEDETWDWSLAHFTEQQALEIGISGQDSARLTEELAKSDDSIRTLAEIAQLDTPLREHPLFQDWVRASEFAEIGRIAGLDEEHAQSLGLRLRNAGAIDDSLFGDLELADDQAGRLRTGLALFDIAAGNLDVVQPLLEGRGEGEEAIDDPIRLAARTAEDWHGWLEEQDVAPPAGATLGEYSEQLALRVETRFPTAALIHRFEPAVDDLGDALAIVQPYLGADEAELPAEVTEAAGGLRAWEAGFRHLGVAEILDDPELDPGAKIEHLRERTGWLAAFHQENAHLDLQTVSLTGAAEDEAQGLSWAGLPPEAVEPVRRQLGAWQRTLHLAGTASRARVLAAAGFDSAAAIAGAGLRNLKSATGFDSETAETILYRARDGAIAAFNGYFTFRGALDEVFKGGIGGDPGPDVKEFIRRFDGYERWFGNQSYCDCRHCQSVLGPAAYFVDLMYFIDTRVTRPVFSDDRTDHPLSLKTRRPDLWALELTCENTDRRLPYLAIINEVLERYLAAGAADAWKKVYEQVLPGAWTFHQPFHLPFFEAGLWLRHFETGRGEIARTLLGAGAGAARLALDLGPEEHWMILKEDTFADHLERLYARTVSIDAATGECDRVEPRDLLRPMGLSRSELGDLLSTRCVSSAAGGALFIEEERRGPDSYRNDVEYIYGLNARVLDRMHRFTRLRRRLPWTAGELDLVLQQMAAGVLDREAVVTIARLRSIQDRFGTPVEETLALCGNMPAALADRRFNVDRGEAQSLPASGKTFVHPAFSATAPTAIDPARLQAGLGVSDQELTALIRGLEAPLGLELKAAADSGKGFALSPENLSLLYRHVRAARQLSRSVEELLAALALADGLPQPLLRSLDDLEALAEFDRWLRRAPWPVETLRFVTGAAPSAAGGPDAAALAIGWRQAVAEEPSRHFSQQLFHEAEGMAAEAVAPLLDFLRTAKLIEAAGAGSFRLSLGFDPSTPLSLPAELVKLKVDEAAVRRLLKPHHADAFLTLRFAADLGVDPETAERLAEASGTPLGDRAWIEALRHPGPDPLAKLIGAVLPLAVVLRPLEPAAAGVGLLVRQRSALGISSFSNLDVSDVRAIHLLFTLDKHGDRQALERLLLLPRAEFVNQAAPALAGYLQIDVSEAGLILRHAEFSKDRLVLHSIARAREVMALGRRLGVNVEALGNLISTDRGKLAAAAAAMRNAFRAAYPDAETRAEHAAPFEQRLLEARRDALVDYLLYGGSPQFTDAGDLYRYFLLDTQLEGCARTSPVLAGISSLQLYVHRCRTNLEQNRKTGADRVRVPPANIPPVEWSWRKNYRVWEANRKVFLFPENFVDPTVRDDKTILFKTLEDELLQTDVGDAAAETALTRYLDQLNKVANLQPLGNFYHQEKRTVHFFARGRGEAGKIHHRTCVGDELWSAWEPLDLPIEADHVSPVVFQGRLFLLWLQVRTQERTKFVGGKSQKDGYDIEFTLHVSYRNNGGEWQVPLVVDMPTPAATEVLAKRLIHWAERRRRLKTSIQGNARDHQRHGTSLSIDHVKVYPIVASDRLYFWHFDKSFLLDPFAGTISEDEAPYEGGKTTAVVAHYRWDSKSTGGLIELLLQYLDTTIENDVEDGLNRFTFTSGRPQKTIGLTGLRSVRAVDTRMSIIHNRRFHYQLQVGDQTWALRKRWLHHLERLSTTVGPRLSRALYEKGVAGLLSLKSQQTPEDEFPFTLTTVWLKADEQESRTRIPLEGSYGPYYQELFFHVPFLIANHLNAAQRFEDAQRWYHYLFDPTAKEAGASPQDGPWRFVGFRNIRAAKLKATLRDRRAIETYKQDPFNPHAIARLRVDAYRKAVVMRYVDNLLDWGDHLFAQDTVEAINEASLLYTLAADVLGERPADLGPCSTAAARDLTYGRIGPQIEKASELLIEIENLVYVSRAHGDSMSPATPVEKVAARRRGTGASASMAAGGMVDLSGSDPGALFVTESPGVRGVVDFGDSLVKRSVVVFCVPVNEQLVAYWDRVEDRLFKIRHCMNIAGVKRDLPLFQPPIDPMLLVRARAAGIDVSEALRGAQGQPPPYRFQYLLERAKSLAAETQAFGQALQAAIDRRDGEELAQLQTTHQQNMLNLTTQLRHHEIRSAQISLAILQSGKAEAEFRRDYFDQLLKSGRSFWEEGQVEATTLANGIRMFEAGVRSAAMIGYLIPNLGAPTAITFGGRQIGDSTAAWAELTRNTTILLDSFAANMAMEANFHRRDEEWRFQVEQVKMQLAEMEVQILGADLRIESAEHELKLHQTALEQQKEQAAFLRDKFSNLGLFLWSVGELQKMYRELFQMAYQMAKTAERAYRFEREDDSTVYVQPGQWQGSRAGLLAGERLTMQLHRMEIAWIEADVRGLDVDHTLSVGQFDPVALMRLRDTGTTDFEIPEWVLDLAYPGQYGRKLKSVRVSLPCVVGPYVNVNAKLTLLQSQVRRRPDLDPKHLIDVPRARNEAIVTSTGQNDPGLLDLQIAGERYLPFEAAGAISRWRLELPGEFRSFDYGTIADVVMHLGYSARDDAAFGAIVQAGLKKQFLETAEKTGLVRLLSLKHEFADDFYRLAHSEIGDGFPLELTRGHFPYFLKDQELEVGSISLVADVADLKDISQLGMSFGNQSFTQFKPLGSKSQGTAKSTVQNLQLPVVGKWQIQLDALPEVLRAKDGGTPSRRLRPDALEDLVIVLNYRVAPTIQP